MRRCNCGHFPSDCCEWFFPRRILLKRDSSALSDKDEQTNKSYKNGERVSREAEVVRNSPDIDGTPMRHVAELFESDQDQHDFTQQYPKYQHSDAESIISEGSSTWSHQSSLSSASSLGSQPLQTFYMTQLTNLFWDDQETRTLIYDAVGLEKIGKDRLQRNLPRLLKLFLTDLRPEADSKEDLQSLRMARTQFRSASKEICLRAIQLRDLLEPFSPQESSEDLLKIYELSSSEDNTNSDDDYEMEDENPDMNRAKNFLLSSWAFTSFRQNLRNFVYPTFQSKLHKMRRTLGKSFGSGDVDRLGEILVELLQVEPTSVSIQKKTQTGWADRLKASAEDLTRERWDWWPLQKPVRPCIRDLYHLQWKCVSKAWLNDSASDDSVMRRRTT
jgi:hypothetical protein